MLKLWCPGHSSLFQHIPEYTSIFQYISAYCSLFQPISYYSRLLKNYLSQQDQFVRSNPPVILTDQSHIAEFINNFNCTSFGISLILSVLVLVHCTGTVQLNALYGFWAMNVRFGYAWYCTLCTVCFMVSSHRIFTPRNNVNRAILV